MSLAEITAAASVDASHVRLSVRVEFGSYLKTYTKTVLRGSLVSPRAIPLARHWRDLFMEAKENPGDDWDAFFHLTATVARSPHVLDCHLLRRSPNGPQETPGSAAP